VIRELIDEGQPIGSCQAGYFRINTRGELEDYLESLQARCDGIQSRINDVTDAYMSEINSRHTNPGIPMKDRCRFYVVYIAETCKIPYQAVWTMAYRKLQKLTGLNLVNLPSWYRGSVLNFVSQNDLMNHLYQVLTDLEEVLI
jgi:hypothetical protein